MTTVAAPVPQARAPWKAVAVPSEHGGWGLTLEPVVLGVLVEPSASGALLGAAAFLAFVARTPLTLALVDRRRGRHLDRTRLATRIAAAEAALLVVLALAAWLLAEAPFWAPLVLALPLVAVELWFDVRSRGRRLVPELAGTIGIGSVAAAIVLAGGGAATTAAGVWLVVAARAVASVPFVRLQLQRAKAHPHHRWACDLAQGLAVALVVGGWLVGWLPPVAPIVVGLLAAVQVVLARTRPPRAALLGAQQVVAGLTVVVTTALGILAP